MDFTVPIKFATVKIHQLWASRMSQIVILKTSLQAGLFLDIFCNVSETMKILHLLETSICFLLRIVLLILVSSYITSN